MTLYIKNMVCDRCIMAVRRTLTDMGLTPVSVELGKAEVAETLSQAQTADLRQRLADIGFELLDDRRQQTIAQIKAAVVRLVHYAGRPSGKGSTSQPVNLSDYLRQELHQDYSALSKLFSEYSSMTIERYYIEQRIERVKELLTYDELTLTQIAQQMDYSSVAYLSAQFKSVTGMTPSQFKRLQGNKRKGLDKI